MANKAIFNAGYALSLVNFRWNLMETISALGYNIVATAPEFDAGLASRFQDVGHRYQPIAMTRAGLNILDDLRYYRELVTLMREESPDLVFSYTMKPVIFGSLAAEKAKVPDVYAMITGLGYVFTGKGDLKKRLLRRVLALLLRRGLGACKGVFFQNPDDEAEFRKLGLIPRGVAVFQIAGSGINLEHFSYFPAEAQSPGRVNYLLIARMLADKGIREFVKAVTLLDRESCRAILVGPLDSNPAGLRADEIRDWEDAKYVQYVPGAEDVRPFLRACQVYVLPSYREGTPRTVLEAMATGRPIITTDAPGCRETVPLTKKGEAQRAAGEVVMEGENGFLVPVKDVQALRKAMRRFIDEPELIAKMGQRSREIAEAKYDVRKVNQSMMKAMGLLGGEGEEGGESGLTHDQ